MNIQNFIKSLDQNEFAVVAELFNWVSQDEPNYHSKIEQIKKELLNRAEETVNGCEA